MSTRPFFVRLSLLTAVIGAVTIISLGGCPVAQQPTTPTDTATDADSDRTTTGNNQRTGSRPVPPLPTDETTPGGGGVTPGGVTPTDNTNSNTDDNDNTGKATLRVTLTAPNVSTEVIRNQPVDVKYRVDGEPIGVELVYKKDGAEDLITFQSGLNVEGTVPFTTLDPGVYTLGIRALDDAQQATVQFAIGVITVVGDMQVAITQPAQDLIIRPNVPVAVAYDVQTLAKSVSVAVFVDPNRNVDGDEIAAFTSTLKSGSNSIQTQSLQLGINYSIYLQATDSLGQTTGRVYAAKGFRIVPAPTIVVTEPSANATIAVGDPVQVTFQGADTEGQATITVFVDTDGVFNGDEDPVADNLALTETSFTVDTSAFAPGVYFFGAWINDTISGDVYDHDYAAGNRTIPGVTVTAPATDLSVRSPTSARITWTAIYPQSEFPTHEVIRAEDFNNDGTPDGPLTVVQSNFSPGTNNFNISTAGLRGRYMVGVRLIDTSNAALIKFAPGDVIVDNDPPTVAITTPNQFLGLRPNTANSSILMQFTVDDTERLLKVPNGVEIVVARDDDLNGLPDAAPVLVQTSPQLRIGLNFYTFNVNTIEAAGLISDPLHDKYGNFLLGVRVTDDAGQQVTRYAVGGLYVDSNVPAVNLLDPTFDPNTTDTDTLMIIKDRVGSLEITIKADDTSPTAFALLLDKDISLTNNFDGYQLIPQQTGATPPNPPLFDTLLPNEQKTYTIDLSTVQAGLYYYNLLIADKAGGVARFVQIPPQDKAATQRIWIRDRLIGTFNVTSLLTPPPPNVPSKGVVLQGFNFNDLAGSSMSRVPDVDGDGDDEFVIVSRFGKPYIINNTIGVGFGEAYMVYGNGGFNDQYDFRDRLGGAQTLNAVGRGSVSGLSFPGIRIPLNATAATTGMTEGISDVAVVDDMDGDNLPELVFSFPRVESINLGEGNTTIQHPELVPDISNMGSLEYNAFYGLPPTWHKNEAQFTRGGIVIVSSHNSGIQFEGARNRKADRVVDLHEIGQMFSQMSAPSLVPYVRPVSPSGTRIATDATGRIATPAFGGTKPLDECDTPANPPPETEWVQWDVAWDVVFNNQPAGGFKMPWSIPVTNPPLCNPQGFGPGWAPCGIAPPPFYNNHGPHSLANACTDPKNCFWTSRWFDYTGGGAIAFPCTDPVVGKTITNSWCVQGARVWSGFYGPLVTINDFSIGARIMGQQREDRFGTAVGTDGTWLYISAPRHTAIKEPDVPLLTANRVNAGVIYQYRVDTRQTADSRTRSQLWMEPGQFDSDNDGTLDTALVWPDVDVEGAKGPDTTMPVPHQYIIEDIGSVRGGTLDLVDYSFDNGGCPPSYAATGGSDAAVAGGCYQPYAEGTAGYNIDRTPQIVGPHTDSRISYVRGLGDVNDDGIRDFAVGSTDITDPDAAPTWPAKTGPAVGAIFIVYSRSTGLQGDYLLDQLALPLSHPQRLTGVLIKGTATEQIARVFDNAGDFNGDGVDDVVVGSSVSAGGKGVAIVVLGSRTLVSPAGGYSVGTIVSVLNNPNDPQYADYRTRFIVLQGANVGDFAGSNVAGAGDVDGDGMGDILVAAAGAVDPGNAAAHPGVTYLMYGSKEHQGGVIELSRVGQPPLTGQTYLPGVVFVGRFANGGIGGGLGGGETSLQVNPAPDGPTRIFSRGVATVGDIDGDGRDDYAISDMLGNPNTKTKGGEVYVLYGRGDTPILP